MCNLTVNEPGELSQRLTVVRVHPVHLMNREQRPTAADIWVGLNLDRESICIGC